jgi:hypothetical protein
MRSAEAANLLCNQVTKGSCDGKDKVSRTQDVSVRASGERECCGPKDDTVLGPQSGDWRSRVMYRIHSDAGVADSTAVKLEDSGVEWKRFGWLMAYISKCRLGQGWLLQHPRTYLLQVSSPHMGVANSK